MLKLADSLRFMKTRNFNVADFYECASKSELLSAFDRMQKPVVLKISSEEHLHKTDVGGIVLGINDKKKLLSSYAELKNLSAKVVLQEQKKGLELIIGIHNDGVFGQMIMLGIGGVFVELIKDVSFRKIPISLKDADDMINELRFNHLLKGFRGSEQISKSLLAKLLMNISETAMKEKIKALDLNPVIFSKNDYFIVDARVLLKKL